jgi:hypothetical protein
VKHSFKYYVEENQGRILVKFGEGSGQLSEGEAFSYWAKFQNLANSYASGSQPQGRPQQGYQHQQHQTGGSEDLVEEIVKKAAPVMIKKMGQCCIIL